MRIGYACLTYGNITSNFKTITKKTLTVENLLKVIDHNLNALEEIIDYNIENNLDLFRITSDLIPFGSSSLNVIEWDKIFGERFHDISLKILDSGIRVSMHPGQYSVLNSPREEVVTNTIDDLKYHEKVLNLLGTDKSSKIVLHIGGVYGDKKSSIDRFIENYNKLENAIMDRVIIENDDKSYTIEDVMHISSKAGIPVVFDNLHHKVNNCGGSDLLWIDEARKTWLKEDGVQKIHYSQQDTKKSKGAHSFTIDLGEFKEYMHLNFRGSLDVMLEVKDKNLSAIKVSNFVRSSNINKLEVEWSRYKYNILEKSPKNYNSIRQLLKDKEQYPIIEFYNLIDISLSLESTIGNQINAIEHVWGYFKDIATEEEKKKYFGLIAKFKEGRNTSNGIKKFLKELAFKYERDYLMNSYYFSI